MAIGLDSSLEALPKTANSVFFDRDPQQAQEKERSQQEKAIFLVAALKGQAVPST